NPVDKPGLAQVTTSLLVEGAAGQTGTQLADRAQSFGANVETDVQDDYATLTIECLHDHVAAALALLADVATHPTLGKDELERNKKLVGATFDASWDSGRAAVLVLFKQALFGEQHPYASPRPDASAAVAKISARDVASFYHEYWNPKAMSVVLVGDVTPEE